MSQCWAYLLTKHSEVAVQLVISEMLLSIVSCIVFFPGIYGDDGFIPTILFVFSHSVETIFNGLAVTREVQIDNIAFLGADSDIFKRIADALIGCVFIRQRLHRKPFLFQYRSQECNILGTMNVVPHLISIRMVVGDAYHQGMLPLGMTQKWHCDKKDEQKRIPSHL